MKAIVANALFGGTLGCLSWVNPTMAGPPPSTPGNSLKSLVSVKLPSPEKTLVIPQLSGAIDLAVKTVESARINSQFSYDRLTTSGDRWTKANFPDSFSSQKPYIHRSQQTDLIFGFQDTFWSSQKKRKYWGVTTVQLWGENTQQPNLSELDYTNSAPKLAVGSSSLTVSGGGENNLIETANDSKDDYFSEFEDFRGGVTYHHGVADELTMGVGFIYDELLQGFTQFTYDSDVLPIQTTVSLLAKESDVNLHSHIRFEPAANFVVNYYHEAEKQKFDLNWDVISGFAVLAKGDIKNESYSTGIKVAVSNDYLSFSATAALDHDRNLDWKLNSQMGRFKFVYSNNQQKSSLELNTHLFGSPILGFECSVFVKHQNREVKQEQEEFIVWGSKLHSTKKVGQNQYWSLSLGYGSGEHGKGAVVKGAIAVTPDLSLKLNYQEISAVSDDTEIKLELSSE